MSRAVHRHDQRAPLREASTGIVAGRPPSRTPAGPVELPERVGTHQHAPDLLSSSRNRTKRSQSVWLELSSSVGSFVSHSTPRAVDRVARKLEDDLTDSDRVVIRTRSRASARCTRPSYGGGVTFLTIGLGAGSGRGAWVLHQSPRRPGPPATPSRKRSMVVTYATSTHSSHRSGAQVIAAVASEAT
jgi:hypothetical protein